MIINRAIYIWKGITLSKRHCWIWRKRFERWRDENKPRKNPFSVQSISVNFETIRCNIYFCNTWSHILCHQHAFFFVLFLDYSIKIILFYVILSLFFFFVLFFSKHHHSVLLHDATMIKLFSLCFFFSFSFIHLIQFLCVSLVVVKCPFVVGHFCFAFRDHSGFINKGWFKKLKNKKLDEATKLERKNNVWKMKNSMIANNQLKKRLI